MTEDQKIWYAFRVTYSRELTLKKYLDQKGIENFVPMRYEIVMQGEQRVRKLVPSIHNLIFVRSTQQDIKFLKERMNTVVPVRYLMDAARQKQITIPDKQMNYFITVSSQHDQAIVYLDPFTTQIPKGTRVRVLGGVFAGIEGELVRIRHDRRVVVRLEGIMAVATTFIHPSLIETI